MNRLPFLAAPEDAGGGGGGEPAPAAAPATESAPASPAPAPSQSPTPDYGAIMSRLDSYEKRDTEWREFYTKADAEQRQNNERIREVLERTFDPQGFERRNAPQYVTREELVQVREQARIEAQATAYQNMVSSEIESAKEKYSRVADFYGDSLDEYVIGRWRKTGERPTKIVAELDGKIGKAIESANAKIVQGKEQMQKALPGDGKPGRPAPAEGADHGFRGRGRLAAIRNGQI